MDAMMTRIDERPVVALGGELLDFDELVRYMDPVLLDRAATDAGYGAIAQRVVDRYLELHRARYGEEFIRGSMVALW